jgi:hypothetical protein
MRCEIRRALALLVVLTLAACAKPENPHLPPPRQTIVAVDLSGSQAQSSLSASREVVERLIQSISYGDRFGILEMNQTGVRGDLRRYLDSVPALADTTFITSIDRDNLEGTRAALMALVPLVFDTAKTGKIAHTDILSTLFVAGEYVRDTGGRPTTLFLLSDMLQSAGGIEMSKQKRMPRPDWIAKQKAQGTLPDLRGVCVVVIGADASTDDGVAVRKFWSDYFKATGAELQSDDWRLLAPGAGVPACQSSVAGPTRGLAG